MKKNPAAFNLIIALGLGLLLCSCASGPRSTTTAWMQDGQKVGTIQQRPTGTGTINYYRDLSGHVVRMERVGKDGLPLPGSSITTLTYANGEMVEERHLDAAGHLAATPDGFALRRWNRTPNPEKNGMIVELSLLDANTNLICGKSGFAVMREVINGNHQTKDIRFLDCASNPAPSLWMGVPNVVEARYDYLVGVVPVTCVALLDATGNVIARKELTGGIPTMQNTQTVNYYNQPNYYYYNQAPGNREPVYRAPAVLPQRFSNKLY